MSIYEKMGVRRVVNARGRMTLLGGSVLPKEILEAMIEANKYFVNLEDLQDRAGKIIAELLGAEDALVTSGAFSALVLATAACMTRGDTSLMERLPFTEGMKNEVIIQRGLRVKYDRAITVAGAKIVEVGTETGTKAGDIEEAINERTAAIHFLAPGKENSVPLSEVLKIAERHDVPVIVDAAGQVLPVEKMRRYPSMGADMVCFGAKYFDGPNSAGVLCGRGDLVESAKLQTFICFESRGIRTLGRGMKLDRQEIIATVVALQRWMTMDHEARLKGQHERMKRLAAELNRILGIRTELAGERLGITTSVHVKLNPEVFGMPPREAVKALKNMDPEVWVGLKDETIVINADTLVEGDEDIIVSSFKQISSSCRCTS